MPTPRPLPSLVDVQNLTSANSEHACNFHVIKIPPLYSNTTNSIPKEAGGVTAEKIYTVHEHEQGYAKPRVQQRKTEKAGEGEKTRRSARRQPADARDAAKIRQARSHCSAGRRRAARGRARSARDGGPGRKAGGEANGDARNTGGAATGTKARASATDQRPTARRGPGARQESPDRPPTHEGAANTGARIPAGATGPAGGPRRAARPC